MKSLTLSFFWKILFKFLCFKFSSCTSLVGLCGNAVSIIVLRSDRERKEALFLLQMLAAADLSYLIVSQLRYPAKYLITDKNVYVNMQVGYYELQNHCVIFRIVTYEVMEIQENWWKCRFKAITVGMEAQPYQAYKHCAIETMPSQNQGDHPICLWWNWWNCKIGGCGGLNILNCVGNT